MQAESISLKEKLCYGIGAYGKDLVYAIVSTFIMVYYTDIVGVSPAFVGVVFLVARIWDAINDPIMGWIVDNTKTRWGKFRPWILSGTIINSIVLALLFLNPSDFLQGTLVNIWCAVTYILWGMTYTLMDVPYWAMIPSFSSDSKVRDQMASIPRLFANLGQQTVVTLGLMMIAFLGVNMGATDSEGYFRFAFIVAVLFNICEIICVCNVKEHVVIENKEKIKPLEVFKIIGNNDQLVVIIIMTVLNQVAASLWLGMNLYFFKYVVQHDNWLAIFGVMTFFVGTASFLIFPTLVNKLSRKAVYILSAIFYVLGLLGMFLVGDSPDTSVVVFFIFAAFFSIGNALAGVSTSVMLADTVDYGEFKTGKRSEAIVFSVQTFSAKFGTAIAGFVGGLVLSFIGYVPNAVQTAETILGLRIVMFIVSSVIFIVIVLIYIKFYKLNGNFYKEMLSTLEITRKQNR